MPIETAQHPRAQISPGRLWFGTAAAAVAWALQGVICEIISAKACQNNIGSWGARSPGAVGLLMAVVTLIALVFAVAGGLISFRNWRQAANQFDLLHTDGRRRIEFMALVGTLASVAFVVGILWAGIPLIMLDVCVKAR